MMKYKWLLIGVLALCILVYIINGVRKNEANREYLAKNGVLGLGIVNDMKKKAKRNNVVYYYEYTVENQKYDKMVQYNYSSNDLELGLGDSIYILYNPSNPAICIDYRYLVEFDYDIDSVRYKQEMKSVGFVESPTRLNSSKIRL